MKYLSVCSGIEAASVAEMACAKCDAVKPLEEFHRHKTGRNGRHSWCKSCCNAYYRVNRKRNYTPEQKRRWQLATRYGMTPAQVEAMTAKQDGMCAICGKRTEALVVDHCHTSGVVRGMLCHACNIMLPALERKEWKERATQYLHAHEVR